MAEAELGVAGLACRFPGAADRHAFWENLLAKKVSISSVSPDRWDPGTFVSAEREAGTVSYTHLTLPTICSV